MHLPALLCQVHSGKCTSWSASYDNCHAPSHTALVLHCGYLGSNSHICIVSKHALAAALACSGNYGPR